MSDAAAWEAEDPFDVPPLEDVPPDDAAPPFGDSNPSSETFSVPQAVSPNVRAAIESVTTCTRIGTSCKFKWEVNNSLRFAKGSYGSFSRTY